MKKLVCFLMLWLVTMAQAQSVSEKDCRIIEKLQDRSTFRFVGNEVRKVLNEPYIDGKSVLLVVQENGVNRLSIDLDSELLARYHKGELSLDGVFAVMGMTNDIAEAAKVLREKKQQGEKVKADRYAWKPELVFYPQLKMFNSSFQAAVNYAVGIAPALEMNLWKGAHFTGQVIFPIATNMNGIYKRVRPGVIALEQRFAFGGHWHGSVAGGNFTNDRMGVFGELYWRSASGRWEFGAEAGNTVESTVTQKDGWRISKKQRANGALTAKYYMPKVNIWSKLSAGRFIYGDWGGRAEIVRAFGEYIVGVYGIYTDKEYNAGFVVSVPLPTRRYMKNRGFRVRAAEYWSLEYSYKVNGRFTLERMGKTYRTRPEKTWTNDCWQPDYIRYYLLRELEK